MGYNIINTEKNNKKRYTFSKVFFSLFIAYVAPAGPPACPAPDVVIDDDKDDDSSITVSIFSRAGLGSASVLVAHRERKIVKLFLNYYKDFGC